MSQIRVESSDDPHAVLRRAGAFLASRPVRHNLILTLLHARVSDPEPGRYWIVEDGSEVAGVAFQSPLHFPVVLSPMPGAAISALVAAIAEQEVLLPEVTGEAATTARFAGEWTERGGFGATPSSAQRLYELTGLHPMPLAPGRLRAAVEEDADVVVKWFRAFEEETGERYLSADDVKRRLASGRLWFWEDVHPVSLAGNALLVEGVARIGPVFTPVDLRRRGYGSSCVAALSQRFLHQGLRCTLFADLANPVSNAIYRRMGYRAVAEILRYRFD